MSERRLIEAGFPCHQVGAETKRERDAVSVMPPNYFLHVWWARRPLTASRAAIAGSLLPEDTDIASFVRELGIEKKVIKLTGGQWVILGKLVDRIEQHGENEFLTVDPFVVRAFERESARRAANRETIATLKAHSQELSQHPVLLRWENESQSLGQIHLGETLRITRVMGDPAHINERIIFKKDPNVKRAIGKELSWDNEDSYGYNRAYQNDHSANPTEFTVLDPTAGGGAIPFEALRLGHKVIANELNPVASTILYATLDYPARFGAELYDEIKKYGNKLLDEVHTAIGEFYPTSGLCAKEKNRLEQHLKEYPELIESRDFNQEVIADYLYTRQVTCPSCSATTPLLNSCWLSKEPKDSWGVKVKTRKENNEPSYNFAVYQVANGTGPDNENPDEVTLKDGTGQCVHCKQAITSDEIKSQAAGLSPYGEWKDQLYAIVTERYQPKLDSQGNLQFFKSGLRKGEIKTEKIRFFRAPNETDQMAIEDAAGYLHAKWEYFDSLGLIPTEKFPEGNDMRPVIYGMEQWYKLFNHRQLLGHLFSMEILQNLKSEILDRLGYERGRAVVTYLQFAIDKCLDYNSKQTGWHQGRGVIEHAFKKHAFPIRWIIGEMVIHGENSGLKWAFENVLKSYSQLSTLLYSVNKNNKNPPVKIINGTAAYLEGIDDKSIDLICIDPPYYNNVQYAELSDFFYVWMKRTLKDLYPEFTWSRFTNKREEAVASPFRDGSTKKAKAEYKKLMCEIFLESRRVVKDNGLMTLMFTHKSPDAWETLIRSLVEAGWKITSCFPVESESGHSTHQKDMASAASSFFITCRKRQDNEQVAFWSGLGGTGVKQQIRSAVENGLEEFKPLKLNAVDQMIACYGRALQVLSEHWPVMDGDEEVSPIRAMNEASSVVAARQITEITHGRISVDDLDTETAMALTMYGIWGHNDVAFSEVLNLSRSLNIRLETRTGGYGIEGRMVGINTDMGARRAVAGQAAEDRGYAAPLVKKGSKLRLSKPEERSDRRIVRPQSDWDVLHGLLLKFREGDIPVARAYLDEHREGNDAIIIDLLEVWSEEAETPKARSEAKSLMFGLRQDH